MKRLKVKNPFWDKTENNRKRNVGEEFEASDERANDLISRGFAISLEDKIEKKVKIEEAVKEIKKEKAVKEKKAAKK